MSAPETRGSDPGLRERLHQAADAAAPRSIDVDAVLAASRARRRARRTAALGVTATAAVLLAVGGIAIAVNGLGPNAASNSALTSESAGTAPEAGPEGAGDDAAGTRLAAPEQVNLCGAPVAGATDASASGLVVAVEPPAAIARGATVDVRVTVTNAGPSPVTGELRAAPALAVADDGITRWHTNGVVSDESVPIALIRHLLASIHAERYSAPVHRASVAGLRMSRVHGTYGYASVIWHEVAACFLPSPLRMEAWSRAVDAAAVSPIDSNSSARAGEGAGACGQYAGVRSFSL